MLIRYLALVFLIPGSLLAQPSHPKGAQKLHLPKVGTMFVNSYYVTDSSGALVPKSVIDPRMDDDTLFIVQSGVRLYGRPNCIVIAAKSHPDTILESFANNGDLYMRGSKDTEWTRFPFGMAPGKKIVQQLDADSGTMFGHDFFTPHNRTTEVLGHDTVSVGAKVYDCIKLLVDDIRLYKGRNWEQGSLFWYSPELGYLVRLNMGWNVKYFLNQQIKIWR
jgi:hypothetical protein